MNVELREATGNDADFLYRLHRAAMKTYVVETWGKWDEEWQLEYFTQQFDPHLYKIIVAGNTDIGVLSAVKRETDLFLRQIALLPEYQGQGIGSQLILKLIAEARQSGIPIVLQVLKANRARTLYERLGFSITSETPTHYLMSTIGRG